MPFLTSGRCISRARLDGKTAIITGCNTALGKINAKDFFERGCKVIMACRRLDKAQETAESIREEVKDGRGELVLKQLDLSSFNSVRQFARDILAEEKFVHILVNNAGVMLCPKTITEDGHELQFQTNHLSHFLLTMLLLSKIKESPAARIVNVTSVGHKYGNNNFEDINWDKRPYNAMAAYGQSKLANIHFTTELAKRLQGTGVSVYAVHPGWVKTDLGRHLDAIYFPGFRVFLSLFLRWFMKTPEEGAQTQIHCAVDEEAGKQSGLYYADCRVTEPYAVAKDSVASSRLWDISVAMVNLDVAVDGEILNKAREP